LTICPKLLAQLTDSSNWKITSDEFSNWYAKCRIGDYVFKTSKGGFGTCPFEDVRFKKVWWIFPISGYVVLDDSSNITDVLEAYVKDIKAEYQRKYDEKRKHKIDKMMGELC